MPAPKGSRNAAKPDEVRLDGTLTLRLTRAERALIDAVSPPEKPTAWARRILVEAASVERAPHLGQKKSQGNG